MVGEGTVQDFSPGGCRILSFTPAVPGSGVELCIYPDETSGGLLIQLATVCWARDYEFGVAFVAIDPEVTPQLAHLWSESRSYGVGSCNQTLRFWRQARRLVVAFASRETGLG